MAFIRSCIRKAREAARFLQPLQIPLHSAYTGFYLILSLFPALLLLLGLLRYTNFRPEDLMAFLEGWLPESLLPTARSLVDSSYEHSSGAVISLSVVAALWSASRGMLGLRGGLNAVYGIPEQKGYWYRRLDSMFYTAAFLLLLSLTLVLHVFGNAIVDYLLMTTRPALLVLMRLVDLRFLLLLLLQILLFTLMYAWLPAQRFRLLHSLPGAVFCALLWSIFSKLFSVYVLHFSRYSNIFGSVYALALGMLWLYFCISIFFWGGLLNRLLAQRRRSRNT